MEEATAEALSSTIDTLPFSPVTTFYDNVDRHDRLTALHDLKTKEPRVSMSQQGGEALNRTFTELKSKDEDRRRLAAYDLYQLVTTASRGEMLKILPLLELT